MPTTIQYPLIQNYEYYTILSKYLLFKKPKYLSEWYKRNLEIQKKNKSLISHTFVETDWYARYYFDEYENETKPQKSYFLMISINSTPL